MARINFAQTFYVDSTLVQSATEVDISAIDLYFKTKNVTSSALPSAAIYPGITMYLCESVFGVPQITNDTLLYSSRFARVEFDKINISSDGSIPTKFVLETPFKASTDKEYALFAIYDAGGQFEPWLSKQGDFLVNTTTRSPGPSGKYTGSYYGQIDLDLTGNQQSYASFWRPTSDSDLKFTVYAARYFHNGYPVESNTSISEGAKYPLRRSVQPLVVGANNQLTFAVNFKNYELISFDQDSTNQKQFVGGQYVYQNTVSYPGGPSALTISTQQSNVFVTANSLLPNGQSFNWNTLYTQVPNQFVTLKNGINVNVRQIKAIVSNTTIELMEPPSFTNASAQFMVTPVAIISNFDRQSIFGYNESVMFLRDSTANSTVRFVNNVVESVTVSSGGSGYNNSDIFYVRGYEDVGNAVRGGYIAVANISTNSTGGISNVFLSNCGAGFVNSAAITVVVANSSSGNTTANTSAGSGATFSISTGATLRTEYTTNVFKNCKIVNVDIASFVPFFNIQQTATNPYTMELETRYYQTTSSNTSSGYEYYVTENPQNYRIPVRMNEINYTSQLPKIPSFISRSNEFNIVYSNGNTNPNLPNTQVDYSQQLRMYTTAYSNNDFNTLRIAGRPTISLRRYVVNNLNTYEHTDYGLARAKHITKPVTFARLAEDIRVFLTAYKPANTNIEVYARIINNSDPDAFDDKDWTKLQLIDGANVISSSTDTLDYKELTFGFFQVPSGTRTSINGVFQASLANDVLACSGGTPNSQLTAGDLVYMYQPAFPNNHYVSVITAANTTTVTLDTVISNTSLTAEPMKLEKITLTNPDTVAYPSKQAFNDIQNSNTVTYHNSSMSKFSGYNKVAVKVLFLSENVNKVPRIDDIKIVGVSA